MDAVTKTEREPLLPKETPANSNSTDKPSKPSTKSSILTVPTDTARKPTHDLTDSITDDTLASTPPAIVSSDPPPEGPGADDTGSWGAPAGLEPRTENDQRLTIFRHALGIDCKPPANTEPSSVEEGQKRASGIYRAILTQRRTKAWQFNVLSSVIYSCHVVQILVGAALTALGPGAGSHTKSITSLGALNTVIAGILALIKGQGLPDRLHKDEVEFRRLQDWIEETDALLAAGTIGRDRREVGQLIETAFKKYNAVMASEENNKPQNYVRQSPEGGPGSDVLGGNSDRGGHESDTSEGSNNAVVRLSISGS